MSPRLPQPSQCPVAENRRGEGWRAAHPLAQRRQCRASLHRCAARSCQQHRRDRCQGRSTLKRAHTAAAGHHCDRSLRHPRKAHRCPGRNDAQTPTCDLSSFTGGVRESISTPETHALGGGKSLVILPCSTGAYNLIGLVFVVDGTKITPAQLDACSGFEATGADTGTSVKSVINGEFKDGVLTSYAKGRPG